MNVTKINTMALILELKYLLFEEGKFISGSALMHTY